MLSNRSPFFTTAPSRKFNVMISPETSGAIFTSISGCTFPVAETSWVMVFVIAFSTVTTARPVCDESHGAEDRNAVIQTGGHAWTTRPRGKSYSVVWMSGGPPGMSGTKLADAVFGRPPYPQPTAPKRNPPHLERNPPHLYHA